MYLLTYYSKPTRSNIFDSFRFALPKSECDLFKIMSQLRPYDLKEKIMNSFSLSFYGYADSTPYHILSSYETKNSVHFLFHPTSISPTKGYFQCDRQQYLFVYDE